MPRRPHLDRASPAARHMGRELIGVDPETGETRFSFLARPEFTNRHGTVAGGFLAAMLDSTTAAPILAALAQDESIVTTDLRVSFVRPAATGALFGRGRILSRDDRTVHSEGELTDPDGQVVARATAAFRVVRRKP